ncbi:uncharacterized protein [Salvelinus alpinus]|uniref:uncharacterized protein n=1 Tax=Salvelinus alpinus TaxID=8036 RepID=UPI0039FD4691
MSHDVYSVTEDQGLQWTANSVQQTATKRLSCSYYSKGETPYTSGMDPCEGQPAKTKRKTGERHGHHDNVSSRPQPTRGSSRSHPPRDSVGAQSPRDHSRAHTTSGSRDMTHSSVNRRRSKEPNTGLNAQRLCPEVSCSSGRNGGLGSSVTSAKIGRYENRFASQSRSMPRSHRPSTGPHQKPVTVDNIKKRSVDMSYNQPGSQSSVKSGCRKRAWMFNRRPNNSEEVDNSTSAVLHHVTATNEEANLPREPGADDSGDDSGDESDDSSSGIRAKVPTEPGTDDSGDESDDSSSGIRAKVPTEPGTDDSGDESNTSSSSDSVHTSDDDKEDCHNSVPKHVAERVSSPVKHSVPIKQNSTRVAGVQQDPDTEPCVSAEPEYQYTEDAACSGTVCTVPNSHTTDDTEPVSAPAGATSDETQTQEPDSDETQANDVVSAETVSAETQTPDSDETQANDVVSAETVSETQTEEPDSDETQTKEPD